MASVVWSFASTRVEAVRSSAIDSTKPIRELKDVARRGGTTFLRDSALALVRDGRTDLEEINRVTFVA